MTDLLTHPGVRRAQEHAALACAFADGDLPVHVQGGAEPVGQGAGIVSKRCRPRNR